MPRFRIIAPSFAPRAPGSPPELLPAGTEFEYGGMPGLAFLPLDAEARQAKLQSIKAGWSTPRPGWHSKLLLLAKSLGNSSPATLDDARQFVESWMAKTAAEAAKSAQSVLNGVSA